MKTLVIDWQIVSIIDEQHCYGELLYAIVITDETLRFNVGDYVCSSKIESVDLEQLIVTTIKGSTYELQGDGKNAEIEFKYLKLLKQGFSPEVINQLNLAPNDYFH